MPALSVSTSDVDKAQATYSQIFYDAEIEPVRNSPLPSRFQMKFDTAGPMTFAIINVGSEIIARAGGKEMTYTVAVGLRGNFPTQLGREEVVVNASTALVTTPNSKVTVRGFRTGTEQLFTLALDSESLEGHLRKLLGLDRVSTVELRPSLDLRHGRGSQWWRLASTLALALQSETSLVTHPMLSAPLASAVMTGLLCAADHPYREALDAWTRPVPPPTLRRAIAFIEEYAHQSLTVADVSNAVGCGVRGLQLSFRKHLDTTPAEYIKRVRMDGAHAALRSANPTAATVAGIALMWGFTQPGRFAIQYRKIYGVSPSVTLRGR